MKDYSGIKADLEAKLQELLHRSSELEEVLSNPGSSDSEELAQEIEGDETLAAIGDVTKQEIADIRLALDRIEKGSFGTCSHCGQPVSRERLAAIPWTNTCIHCAWQPTHA